MSNPTNLYEFVMACLRSRKIPQRQVADESGVPFSTLAKIAQGSVSHPSVHTIQRLADYFADRGIGTAQSDSDEGQGPPSPRPGPSPMCGRGASSASQTTAAASTAGVATTVAPVPDGERATAGVEDAVS